jgi:hypothetical protein
MGDGLVAMTEFGVLDRQIPQQVGLVFAVIHGTRQVQRFSKVHKGAGGIAVLDIGESLMFQDGLLGKAVASGAGMGEASFQERQRLPGLPVP